MRADFLSVYSYPIIKHDEMAHKSPSASAQMKAGRRGGKVMEIGVPTILAVYFIMAICVPILPAALIYWLFPKDKMSIGGKLVGNLTVNATGAFAGYLGVLLIMLPTAGRILDSAGSVMKPSWSVFAKVKLVDESGKDVDNPQWLDGLVVQLRPDFYSTTKELVRASVPELADGLPNILLSIPRFGSSAIDLNSSNVKKDNNHKKIEIIEPVVIHKVTDLTAGITLH